MVRAVGSKTICTYVVRAISGLAVSTDTVSTISSKTICTDVVRAISGLTVCTYTVGTVSSEAVGAYMVRTVGSDPTDVSVGRAIFCNNRSIDCVVGINSGKCKGAASKKGKSEAED